MPDTSFSSLPALSIPALPHIPLSFLASLPILLLILFVFFILYSIVSGILLYHWATYGMKSQGIVVGRALFLLVSIALFAVAGMTLYYI